MTSRLPRYAGGIAGVAAIIAAAIAISGGSTPASAGAGRFGGPPGAMGQHGSGPRGSFGAPPAGALPPTPADRR